jgi:putative membrane protein
MKRLLIRWAVLSLSVLAAVYIVPGITISGSGRFFTVIGMALILGIINVFLKPIVKLFSLPVIALTFGLFLLVINAALFALASWILPHFNVSGFIAALEGSIIVSLVSWVANMIVPEPKKI